MSYTQEERLSRRGSDDGLWCAEWSRPMRPENRLLDLAPWRSLAAWTRAVDRWVPESLGGVKLGPSEQN